MTRQQRYLYASGFTMGAFVGVVAGFGLTVGTISYGAWKFSRAMHEQVVVNQTFNDITKDF